MQNGGESYKTEGTGNMEKHVSSNSMAVKMRKLVIVIMIPMTLMTMYLIYMLGSFSNAYNQAIQNLAVLNSYSMTFQQDMDYSLYRIIIGTVSFEELKGKKEIDDIYSEKIRDPYTMISDMQEVLSTFHSISGNDGKVRVIMRGLRYLDRLVQKIEGSGYTDGMELLNKDVYTSTSLLNDNLQDLIARETDGLEKVSVRLNRQIGKIIVVTILILIAILTVLIIYSDRITKSVTRPVKQLCDAMESAAQNEFTIRDDSVIEADGEIGILVRSFKDMNGEMTNLIERIREEQNNLRRTELKLLQAQINPHFLYNTLDAIVWMAEGGQDREVVSMVSSLSEFFRTVLSEGKDSITIAEEEAHIRSYLTIENYRYQDILEYEIRIADEIRNCCILKLTLQPLIENALYHGIKNKRGGGKITVTGYEENGGIRFDVADDGIGMTPEQTESLRRKIKTGSSRERGFGLANVEERIRLNYGSSFGLSVDSTAGKGTCVSVHIPKITEVREV